MPNIRLAACVAAALTLLPGMAFSQAWPNRPVVMTVPFPAGGTADLLARETAQALSEELGQQFVVENRAGGGGNVAGAAVAKATPDGYSILFASQGQAALNKFMFKDAPYDPVRDLVPAIVVAKSPMAVVANLDAPVGDFAGLIAYAKANPGKLNAGHAGIGSMGHITSELLQLRTGIKMNSVPYRGGAPLVVDLVGGHVQLGVDLLSNFVRLAKEGKIRVLAVTSAQRANELPDVPTIQEQVQSPFEATAWFAMMMPAGTPSDIVQKINAVTSRYLKSAKGQELVSRQAMEAGGGSPADAAVFIRSELETWEPVISAANISLN